MKTNLRERLTMYQCVIRPKVHFTPEFSFKQVNERLRVQEEDKKKHMRIL